MAFVLTPKKETQADSPLYGELLSLLIAEERAKCKAYAFIIENNLSGQFKKFCDDKGYSGFVSESF